MTRQLMLHRGHGMGTHDRLTLNPDPNRLFLLHLALLHGVESAYAMERVGNYIVALLH